jgi:hypothetical protein
VQIHWHDLMDSAGHGVAAGKDAAVGRAIADRNHPFRVRRFRYVTIAMVGAWSALALVAVLANLDPDPWTKTGLVLAGVYFVGIGLFDRRPEA